MENSVFEFQRWINESCSVVTMDKQGITNCVCKNNCQSIVRPVCANDGNSTPWSNDGSTIIFANTIGDPLIVNFPFLTIVTTEQLTLTQTWNSKMCFKILKYDIEIYIGPLDNSVFKFQGWINVSYPVVTMVKNVKSTSRGSPIAFAKIIVNPSFDQCVPMTETAMTTCAKCKSMAAKINSIYPPNILASVVSCLEKSHVYRQVHLTEELQRSNLPINFISTFHG